MASAGGGGLADDLDLLVAFEQAADALAHQLMVVEQEHADRHAPIVPATGNCAVLRAVGDPPVSAQCLARSSVRSASCRTSESRTRPSFDDLMDAVLMIEADIELPVLLRHIVEEACSLVGARYGALGVLNEERTGLEQFLTVGLSEADEERVIGTRPTGRGVLGLLITDPKPLRLDDLGSHPESYGFPPGHPPMTSFLGVPIRVRAGAEAYGNLYLTDKIGGDAFSDEDEALAEALRSGRRDRHREHPSPGTGPHAQRARRPRAHRQGSPRSGRPAAVRPRDGPPGHQAPTRDSSSCANGSTGRSTTSTPPSPRSAPPSSSSATARIPGGSARGARAGQRADAFARALVPRSPSPARSRTSSLSDVADHLLAVLRESLDQRRQARACPPGARHPERGGRADPQVIDDGVGVDPARSREQPGLGLKNLRTRAEKLDGHVVVEPAMNGGTKLTWRVPLATSAHVAEVTPISPPT